MCWLQLFWFCVAWTATVLHVTLRGKPQITAGLGLSCSNTCFLSLSTTGGFAWNLGPFNQGKRPVPVSFKCPVYTQWRYWVLEQTLGLVNTDRVVSVLTHSLTFCRVRSSCVFCRLLSGPVFFFFILSLFSYIFPPSQNRKPLHRDHRGAKAARDEVQV